MRAISPHCGPEVAWRLPSLSERVAVRRQPPLPVKRLCADFRMKAGVVLPPCLGSAAARRVFHVWPAGFTLVDKCVNPLIFRDLPLN